MAVKSENVANVSTLVQKGAKNLDEALLVAKMEGKHRSRALLLLVKAAMSNDVELLLNLYGPPTNTNASFYDVQLALSNCEIPIDVPVEIAGHYGNTAVREELLLRRKGAQLEGFVPWHALHLSTLNVEWLQRLQCVLHLRLDHNKLWTIPCDLGSALPQVRT